MALRPRRKNEKTQSTPVPCASVLSLRDSRHKGGCTIGVKGQALSFPESRPGPILLPESFCHPLRRRNHSTSPGPIVRDDMRLYPRIRYRENGGFVKRKRTKTGGIVLIMFTRTGPGAVAFSTPLCYDTIMILSSQRYAFTASARKTERVCTGSFGSEFSTSCCRDWRS
jgi:hypothetical protein